MRAKGFLRRPARLALGLAAVVVVLVGGGVAVAAIPGADGVITGCFDKRTGALRIIDAAKQTCRQSETRLTWNQRGARGPAGATGLTGATGLPGPAGPAGPAGAGVGSFDDLIGLPCREGTAREGVIRVSYHDDVADARCVPADLSLLAVDLAGDGTGMVTSAPAGITCGTDCATSYAHAEQVTLTAAPGEGSTFAGWGGACSGTALSCTVAMDQARDVTATFHRVYGLSVSPGPPLTLDDGTGTLFQLLPGYVTGPGDFRCDRPSYCTFLARVGDRVSFTAHAHEDALFDIRFLRWEGDCQEATGPVCTMDPEHGLHRQATAYWSATPKAAG